MAEYLSLESVFEQNLLEREIGAEYSLWKILLPWIILITSRLLAQLLQMIDSLLLLMMGTAVAHDGNGGLSQGMGKVA